MTKSVRRRVIAMTRWHSGVCCFLFYLKEQLTQKYKSCHHSKPVLSVFCRTQKMIFEERLSANNIPKMFLVQNVLFCVPQKRETHTGFNQDEGE